MAALRSIDTVTQPTGQRVVRNDMENSSTMFEYIFLKRL
jgi:hypothetical protein